MTYNVVDLINDLCTSNVPINDEIYNYLCPTDRVRLVQLLKTLGRVRDFDQKSIAELRKNYNKSSGATRKHKHIAVASIQAVKSNLTGRLLERVIRLLVRSCQPVTALTNLRSSTAEIDLLLHLGPVSSIVPVFKLAGSHIIGEAKCYSSGFKQEWVNELRGLMAQHQCTHSILFVGCPSKILKIDHRHGLHLHAAQGNHIIPFGMRQLNEIAAGENFLTVLGKQYIDVKIGAVSLSI